MGLLKTTVDFFAPNIGLWMAGIGVAGALGLGAYAVHIIERPLVEAKQNAEQSARVATGNAQVQSTASNNAENTHASESNINTKLQVAQPKITQVQGSMVLVPNDVAAGWSSAIDGLRAQAAATPVNADTGAGGANSVVPTPR